MQKILINPVFRIVILSLLLCGLVGVAINETDIKNRISNMVFEAYMKAKPRPSSGQIVFVDIDDASLQQLGQWPWPRNVLANIITNIDKAGAKVIIFDGVIAEPDRHSPPNLAAALPDGHPAKEALAAMPDNDDVLAQAIANTGKFVAGWTHGSNSEPPILKTPVLAKRDVKEFLLSRKSRISDGYFQNIAKFLPAMEQAAAGNGSFMISQDGHSTVRETALIFHDGKNLYPSLILEGARLLENNGRSPIKVNANPEYKGYNVEEPFGVTINSYNVPMSSTNKMWVHFRHLQDDETVSIAKFLQPELPDLSGKVVFIGSSAEGLMDLRSTPIGFIPGVKVHINAFEQILQNWYLIRPITADQLEIAAAIVFSLLIILLSFRLNPLWLGVFTLSISAGGVGASWYLFDAYGGLFDPVTPIIIVGFTFVFASILSYLKESYEKRQVRDAFGLYISPEYMKELTSDPDKLQLGGETRDLSVMFTDIRGFTSISEGLKPQELIQLMNDFLTPMSDMVMQNRGTIDKYMGDAMMAFWNAPLDDASHAQNACRAALGMRDVLAPINEKLANEAKASGKTPIVLKAGIGLNSGPCAVGNMGSKQRFAYSVLGDAANLASRLEGQTKSYGVDILIGENTYLAARDDFACLEMDLIRVKGKQEAVRIFALIGGQDMHGDAGFNALALEHDTMITSYRTGSFAAALLSAQKCAQTQTHGLAEFYNLYIRRCEDLIKTPPKDWDGVFVALTK